MAVLWHDLKKITSAKIYALDHFAIGAAIFQPGVKANEIGVVKFIFLRGGEFIALDIELGAF